MTSGTPVARSYLMIVTRDLAAAGQLTGGGKRNRKYLKGKTAIDASVDEGLVEVALDPQTSEGC